MGQVAASEEMQAYFKMLEEEDEKLYQIAQKAKACGKDPTFNVEIPRAEDLASRVEKLLEDYDVAGLADIIRRLSQEYDNREVVAIKAAEEFAKRPAETKEKALDRAVRIGLAIVTEGILVAPLEGIACTRIRQNADGTDFADLVFAGPIRASGGTGQALSVLICDVVRQAMGIGRYIATPEEIGRFNEEIPLYKQCQHLQFTPTSDEISTIVSECPVMVDGEGTEQVEIGGFRDLPRIETNKVRGGACLVIAEGMCLKASKIQKHVDKLHIEGWDFIKKYLDAHKNVDDKGDKKKVVEPSYKYLKDMVAGRPIFGHPCQLGGFRLRYGRARTSGLASLAYNPASMYAMDEFLALGTQLKIERPGKACVVTPVTSIEGPTVLLKNGDLVYCDTKEEYLAVKDRVAEVVDNGEILVPYGEFCENNHVLVPCGYPIERFRVELRAILGDKPLPDDYIHPTFERAKQMCAEYGIALHPDYNLFWNDVKMPALRELRKHILETGLYAEGSLSLVRELNTKLTLETLGAIHRCAGNKVFISERYSLPLLEGLGLGHDDKTIISVKELKPAPEGRPEDELYAEEILDIISDAAGYTIKARAMTRIGTRMGRPEKAKERAGTPQVQALFPLEDAKHPVSDTEAAKKALSKARLGDNGTEETRNLHPDMGYRICPNCHKSNYSTWCRDCGMHTVVDTHRKRAQDELPLRVDIEKEYVAALNALGMTNPKYHTRALKCCKVLTSRTKTPEILEKGILRREHDITVFRDGTIRYDMTDIPLTHFRPKEIGLSVERAHELGYTHDWNGAPLTDPTQICELKCQDIIPSKDCGEYMVRVAQFVDDELEKIYGLERFYKVETPTDLIGHLAFGLAPHTSGCILCRIIGYANVKGCYGHPYYHASKRRNCDGDEDCIILAMDGLLNFSRVFLPARRGGLMDCPLVLTTRLDPNEIDKEARNVDCLREYPKEFYDAAMDMQPPKSVEKIMDLVDSRIGTPRQYEGLGYTHDTPDISEGPHDSAYTTLGSMIDKMEAQLLLGWKCRAVREKEVARLVINKHFMPDMIGNLRSFATQTVRCTKCGEKYRRMPLSGMCNKCGNNLNLTVTEASVRKYLKISKSVCERNDLDMYTQERIAIIEQSMDSLFNSDKVKKCTLNDFF